MNVLSLFDGMSCGRLALDRAGVPCGQYIASEIDKYVISISKANYPDIVRVGGVREVKGKALPKIHLMLGGSPCQGFSVAGKRINFDDPRSKLFFEYVRLMRETKPKYFLLENVSMKQEWQDVISGYLGVKPVKINSALVSPQTRTRLYWTNIPGLTQPKDRGMMVADSLLPEDEVDDKYYLSPKATNLLKSVLERRRDPLNAFALVSSWQRNYTISAAKCPAVTAAMGMGGGHVPMITVKPYRKLTPVEVERMQTVPDDYTKGVSDTQRYKMLGNGWTVEVIAHILKGLK